MNESLAFQIHDRSQAGEARRAVAQWGQDRGWDSDFAGRVALVVTELGNNLALHTAGGSLVLRGLLEGTMRGVEILSLDSGPGIANFNECLRDGYSTAGTAGTGLGAVKRASFLFASHSQVGVGTALLSEVWARPPALREGCQWQSGVLNVAKANEHSCGDSWAEHVGPDVVRVMIADGLGHGEFAREASMAAVRVFEKHPALELVPLLGLMNDALRTTRGAALAVAELDLGRLRVSYAGIGNISASIVAHESSASLVSMNGIVGVNARPARLFTYPWTPGATLIMASDGLKSQWQLNRYPGLLERHPGLIAGVLYRDHVRGSDDATVVAIRSRL